MLSERDELTDWERVGWGESSLPPTFFTEQEHNSENPAVNIYDDLEGFLLMVDAPGYQPHDFELDFSDGVFSISGERSWDWLPFLDTPAVAAMSEKRFRKSFRFPSLVEPDRVQTHFEQGFLMIWLPKSRDVKAGAKVYQRVGVKVYHPGSGTLTPRGRFS